jgi:uncharacterized Zn-binding protein involved in type VI secretion
MYRLFTLAIAGLVAAMLVPAFAADEKKPADKKEVKLEGTMVCGKCKMKETDACSNVVQVKEGEKTVSYYLKDEGAKAAYHGDCCKKDAKVKVTGGTVTEKDGKKWLEGAKVEVVKEEKKDK